MSITIKFDKESEFQWIKCVVDSGALNCTDYMKFLNREFGIPTTQTVNFVQSEEYVNDIKDAVDTYNKRLADKQKVD